MFDNYEKFKKDILGLTKIDLNYYKEKQMRRRIDTIATKNGCKSYDEYEGCEWGCEDQKGFEPNHNRIISKAKEKDISVADVIALINM